MGAVCKTVRQLLENPLLDDFSRRLVAHYHQSELLPLTTSGGSSFGSFSRMISSGFRGRTTKFTRHLFVALTISLHLRVIIQREETTGGTGEQRGRRAIFSDYVKEGDLSVGCRVRYTRVYFTHSSVTSIVFPSTKGKPSIFFSSLFILRRVIYRFVILYGKLEKQISFVPVLSIL